MTKKLTLLMFTCLMFQACSKEPEVERLNFTSGASDTIKRTAAHYLSVTDEESIQQIQIAMVDLNSDGRDEMISHLDNSIYCGATGCIYQILTKKDGQWQSVLNLIAHDLALLPSSTNGMRVLFTNGEISWAWDGKNYN